VKRRRQAEGTPIAIGARMGHIEAMQHRPSIIERAFQLAKSGQCLTVDDIRTQLSQERYEMQDAYIRGSSLLAQLRNHISNAQKTRAADREQPAG
jgi:hypothetical protein